MTAVASYGAFSWKRFALVAGPGLAVMLADTDAGCIITAAQSGAQWGYKLLLLQFILMPVLYIVQELTVRLGIVTGHGHAHLIRHHFGRFWAWVSAATLIISCIGALLTELSGLAGVGMLLNIPPMITVSLVVVALLFMAYAHTYLTVERIAIGLGLFELVFLFVAWLSRPDGSALLADAVSMPFGNTDYLFMLSANIGAVIMPWMIFFHQSSVVERRLSLADLPFARLDTAIGSVLTQLIMAAVIVATAATLGKAGGAQSLDTVEQISEAITPYLGDFGGKLLFGLGMSGGAMVGAIVVTLTAARTFSEVLGVNHSLEHEPREAVWFYGIYTVTLILAALVVLSGVNLVSLSVGVQVLNALSLPVVLAFLYLLARRLPEPWQLKGAYAVLCFVIMAVTTLLGVYSGVAGALN
jgi:Mn2+/Fe2+ NRAMP family transporter